MFRRSNPVPAYRLHKASGQARVIIDGRHVYLGRYGSTESRQRYARLIADPPSCGSLPSPAASPPVGANLTINELILMYWQFAKSYYVKDGGASKEQASMRETLRPLRRLYGDTLAASFGPKSLKAIRQKMIDHGLLLTAFQSSGAGRPNLVALGC